MKRHWRPVALLIVVGVVALAFWQWAHSRPFNDGTWRRVQETGVLRVGMDASFPPFGDTPDGVPVGLDVDLINEIARRLGLRVEIANMGFDGLYDALTTGQIDALISALSFDPTHLDKVMYTRLYIDAGHVIASRDGKYTHMEEMDGRTVAVEYGSQGDEAARIWQRRLHVLKIMHFTTPDEAMDAMVSGKADAAIVDYVSARLYLRAHPGLPVSISPRYVTGDAHVIAIRLSSYDLVGAINDVLDDMQRDGTLDAIIAKWL
jgi:ABC-type amino acid transport substrate-binding protein